MPKIELNSYYQFNEVWFMMKAKQDNDLTDRTSAVYAKIKTKLSWLIR